MHGLNRNIDWPLVGRLAAGSLPTTTLALFALSPFGTHSGAAQAVTGVLGGALAATALVLVFRKRMLAFLGAVVGELDRGARWY